jgi:soluble lytic murein transglycosylase
MVHARFRPLARQFCRSFLPAAAALLGAVWLTPAAAQPTEDALINDARSAFVKRDKARLAAFRIAAVDTRHPLATWVDYWDLSGRLDSASAAEVEAFYQRWPGSYVEDRLRNDWLLELGRRKDWVAFEKDYPRFRMNDDREVNCYGVLIDHLAGKPVLDAARKAWMDQRDSDTGCTLLAQTLYDAKVFSNEDIWRKIRWAVEQNRSRLARQAAGILGDKVDKSVDEVLDKPARYLAVKASTLSHHRSELAALAIARMATSDVDAAARQLGDRWGAILGGEHGSWAWAITAKQAALGLRPEALGWTSTAWQSLDKRLAERPDWSDDTLGWLARASLRLGQGAERWTLVARAIDAMSPTEQADPNWRYWRARAQLGLAPAGPTGEVQRQAARQSLQALSSQLNFYGQLAAEDLGAPQALPARASPLTPAEQAAARKQPGLQRALLAFDAGLRSEAVREWNFSLIGMSDRELLAAAQLACEREIWDRCINSSERTRSEVDMDQRFPTPLKREVLARTADIGLDPAYVYGLIRQESRFIVMARSGAGASGLMQVMPATAKWTARKIGMSDFKPAMITERDTNLRIGTAYLKLVLDDMDGSQALAAAGYNAGPGRPRRWRDGPALEPAIWAENIPFAETRDYVKKVLSNATYYAGLLNGKPASLRSRLGSQIGPRPANDKPEDKELP